MSELESFFEEQYPIIRDRLTHSLHPEYHYHNIRHTMDVIEQSQIIGEAEGLNKRELLLVKIAALFHDTGFLKVRKDHESVSVEYFKIAATNQLLPEDIIQISQSIMATKIPQMPFNRVDKVLCDADLDYLGREDYSSIAGALFREMNFANEIQSEEEWSLLQVQFLSRHHYHTHFSKRERMAGLLQNLNLVQTKL
jgi:predicted metal-dependent HD superfamily phosphohydrolase